MSDSHLSNARQSCKLDASQDDIITGLRDLTHVQQVMALKMEFHLHVMELLTAAAAALPEPRALAMHKKAAGLRSHTAAPSSHVKGQFPPTLLLGLILSGQAISGCLACQSKMQISLSLLLMLLGP